LTIIASVIRLRGATLQLAQSVVRGEEALLAAEVLVAATKEGRATRIPDALREAMEA
jgi:acyl-CoA thioester hydrolase